MKKTIFSTIILLTVTGCAVTQPEDELSLTRSKLEHFLQTREMTQSEMNLINSYALQLSNMEKALLEYRICNRPDYRKIEKAFQADCEAWEKLFLKESLKSSFYEGGTFAPADQDSRLRALVQNRITELKTKWRKN